MAAAGGEGERGALGRRLRALRLAMGVSGDVLGLGRGLLRRVEMGASVEDGEYEEMARLLGVRVCDVVGAKEKRWLVFLGRVRVARQRGWGEDRA